MRGRRYCVFVGGDVVVDVIDVVRIAVVIFIVDGVVVGNIVMPWVTLDYQNPRKSRFRLFSKGRRGSTGGQTD